MGPWCPVGSSIEFWTTRADEHGNGGIRKRHKYGVSIGNISLPAKFEAKLNLASDQQMAGEMEINMRAQLTNKYPE